MMLIRTYRVRGHLAADLDPLRLTRARRPGRPHRRISRLQRRRPRPADLAVRRARLRAGDACARSSPSSSAITAATSASNICTSTTSRSGVSCRSRMEGKDAEIQFTPEGKQSILTKVIHAEQWEKFLARKYVGTKRFGLDGGEGAVPALEAVIKYGGQMGVTEIDVGMAHRGRLNILSNVMGKPAQAIFHEFAGGATNPADVGGSGDVKYHLGTSSDREFDGNKVHLSLLPNPSHLEAVDPVVLGKARAVQTIRGDRARQDRAADPAPRRRRLRRPGRGVGVPELLRPARLRHRRHDPFHHQQPDRLHDQPAVRALVALPVGRRQGHPGADPPRQRRRPRSGHLLLQARDRVPPDVRPRHRHRHVVLPPLRPQRGRRAELHPAADVRRDQEAPADQRDLRQAADRGRRRRPGVDRPARPRTMSLHLEERVPGRGVLPAEQGRLVRGPLGRARPSRRAGARPPQHPDRDQRGRVRAPRRGR